MIKEKGSDNMKCPNCGNNLDLNQKFCTNCGTQTNITEDDLGKITVTREKKVLAFAIPFELFIDDSKIGNLPNNSTLTSQVTLGEHIVKIKSPETTISQNITLGNDKKEVEIRVVPKMGLIAAKPKITQILFK